MKILVYGLNYSPELTGVGKYTGEMCEWLSGQGYEVHVVTGIPFYPQWEALDGYRNFWYGQEYRSGVHVWRCPLYIPKVPSGVKRILHLGSFAISSLPILFRQIFWRPDLVWVVEPAFVCVPSALLVAKLSKAKSWLHIQDFEIDAAFSLGLLRSTFLKRMLFGIERLFIRSFDQVSTISLKMQELLIKKGAPADRVFLFPNWVDTSEIYPVLSKDGYRSISNLFRIQLGLSDKVCAILYSGSMGEKQGLEFIIEAAKMLINRPDICFVMCGQGGSYSRLRSLSAGLANIKWLSLQPLDKLNELLNMADIHLLPQLSNASDLVMPSKLTGIFASGKPVIAIADPSSSLFNIVSLRGIAIPPGDALSLVEVIKDLSSNPHCRKFLGQEARNFALNNFDKSKILRGFELALMSCVRFK